MIKFNMMYVLLHFKVFIERGNDIRDISRNLVSQTFRAETLF